ncbi:MAG: bifunctional phosphoglucose/phosphomannose isomerase [Flavobacteriales bacterium]|jgi:glucose/mannose-6-phosphate isomerase|nr:bifunctional phosphoglucose/phosphomannose isomerase [Flavobacteriales bacterium]MBT7653139.1 bifunctional phosphoglucose/phosphomannose isomerase [Flavobacteriales bacterium]
MADANMRDLIEKFPTQLNNAIVDLSKKDSSAHKTVAQNFSPSGVLIIGMGGSGIGGAIVEGILSQSSKIPVLSCADYSIPGWVCESTLVVACSYSGNTEETIEAVKTASERGSKISVVTSGGVLSEMAKEKDWPIVTMPGGHPPRSQFGRGFTGLTWTLKQFSVFSENMYADLESSPAFLNTMVDTIIEQAGSLADLVENKIIMIYSDTSTAGIATRMRQQLNENSKLLVNTHVLPEMNHNELVGWDSGTNEHVAIIIRTPEDNIRSRFRMDFCSDIFRELEADVIMIDAIGENQMQRLMYLNQLSDWLSLLLAERSGTCPVDIKNIIRLKSALESFNG